MPSTLGGDSLLESNQPLLATHQDAEELDSLPLHELTRTGQQLSTSSPPHSSQRNTSSTIFFEHPNGTSEADRAAAPSSQGEEEEDLWDSDRSQPGMSRRQSSRLRSQKDRADSPTAESAASTRSALSNANGNGYAAEDMNANGVELRRKNASLDSDRQTTLLMSRESFTLDREPPPTPGMGPTSSTSFFELPRQDQRNFALLVLLYFLQGIPMGLAGGSVPFLLKKHLSYGQIGVFSLASYPYSLKLLWSPIVDAVWSPTFGRRKSWILPIQFLSGFGLLYLGSRATQMMTDAAAEDGSGVAVFTAWWFGVVFMCATQDIAVDGWALTLLSPQNLSYASTAQTVGLTAGQFMSYTVFLAFNSPDFANKWFRQYPSEEGVFTLSGYLQFWGWAYIIVTIGLAFLKKEEKTKENDSIMDVYRSMVGVLKLKNIQTVIIIHLIAKIGFQANDAVTNLKLLDKGFSQEDLALTVLIDFPFEIMLGYYVGAWSNKYQPMSVWCWGFMARLVAAVFAQITVMMFPAEGTTTGYLLLVIFEHIYSTFSSTVMFVAISAFHARIADPTIGGTYMTLLATVSNLGGTFPRYFVLKLVDMFTVASCHPFNPDHSGEQPAKLKEGMSLITSTFSCALEAEKQRCVDGGGTCVIERDGYYITNIVCVIFGVLTFFLWINGAAKKLQALPMRAWRLKERDNTR